MEKCHACEKGTLEERRGVFHYESKNRDGEAIAGDFENSVWYECASCGERMIPRELNQSIEKWHYAREGLLTPEEIKAIREKYGLTQVAIARLLGVGEKNFTRWENGLSMQTKVMDDLIRRFSQCPDEILRPAGDSRSRIAAYMEWISANKGENPHAIAAHGGSCGIKNKEVLGKHIVRLLESSK